MKSLVFDFIVCLFLLSCTGAEVQSESPPITPTMNNISNGLLSEMSWMNTPQHEITDSALVVDVGKGTDFFNNPEDLSQTASAPFVYRSMEGNFIARALVEPDFNAQWNAVALMVHIDSLNWVKFAFENSDATGPSIVTVVTQHTSDDANGVVLNEYDQLWLTIAKKGNIYSMHWSTDNITYKMARLTAMPEASEVKIGVEFQSPVGEKATHRLHYFAVEEKEIEDFRKLN